MDNKRGLLKENLAKLQAIAKERTVKTQAIEYDLETLVKKINSNVIKLNPDYQRNHRWDNITSSRLIESLILNIPIPIIYLSQDVDVDEEVEDDVPRYSVIDGQQRLTAIRDYMTNKYELEGLEVLSLLNGVTYKYLPPFLIRRLEERTISCLRIDSTVDSQVKFDIFERLNSGSVQLTPQELRNSVYRGHFNDSIKKIAKTELARKALNIAAEDAEENTRVRKMEDVETVLRFFAIHQGGLQYMKKSFKDFLSDRMDSFNKLSDEEIKKMTAHYRKVLTTILDNFGDLPFTKYKVENGELKRTSKFNVSVYDALTVAISNVMLEGDFSINPDKVQRFKDLFYDDKFASAITGSTNDKSKIESRIKIVQGVLQ